MQGCTNRASCTLLHPMEEPQPVPASAVAHMRHEGQWQNESVIWTDDELPYAATVNEVGAGLCHLNYIFRQ